MKGRTPTAEERLMKNEVKILLSQFLLMTQNKDLHICKCQIGEAPKMIGGDEILSVVNEYLEMLANA